MNKPCPFCGSSNMDLDDDTFLCSVECKECFANGPFVSPRDHGYEAGCIKAWALWNERKEMNSEGKGICSICGDSGISVVPKCCGNYRDGHVCCGEVVPEQTQCDSCDYWVTSK